MDSRERIVSLGRVSPVIRKITIISTLEVAPPRPTACPILGSIKESRIRPRRERINQFFETKERSTFIRLELFYRIVISILQSIGNCVAERVEVGFGLFHGLYHLGIDRLYIVGVSL